MELKISQDLEKDKILTSDCCVECGEGWDQLVNKAISAVARYNEKHKNDERGPVKFIQIKEKFGYLNLYLNYYPELLREELQKIEEESMSICEYCGKPGYRKNIYGWVYCLCDECANKEIERYNKIIHNGK